VESAYWGAPFWHSGGVLFAHEPIPHPPGADARQSLVQHYSHNVERAAELVQRSVQRLRANGHRAFQVVVFSDHPLRVAMWCNNGMYSRARCDGAQNLTDTEVPLLVGSTGELPDLASYTRNDQVFMLVTDLLRGRIENRP
jgi:hypothetical protein